MRRSKSLRNASTDRPDGFCFNMLTTSLYAGSGVKKIITSSFFSQLSNNNRSILTKYFGLPSNNNSQ